MSIANEPDLEIRRKKAELELRARQNQVIPNKTQRAANIAKSASNVASKMKKALNKL